MCFEARDYTSDRTIDFAYNDHRYYSLPIKSHALYYSHIGQQRPANNAKEHQMKNLAIAFSVATLFASAAVSAQEYSGNTSFVSTKTRAEVKAETLAAIQRGELRDGEQYPAPSPALAPEAKTRAEVKAELAAYRTTHSEVSDDVTVVQ
jgi:hypothetical protein